MLMASESLHSAIYQGLVRHRRYANEGKSRLLREFSYQVFMVYLDLHELDTVFSKSRLWSFNKPNLAWFRRKDYLDRKNTPLYDAVADLVEQQTTRRPEGPIRMLTNLRYFGFIINPITCYYCFDKTGKTVETIVAEVTNTPWRQRCHYVLTIDENQQIKHVQQVSFSKKMHVSPFQPLNLSYQWYSYNPADDLAIHIDVNQQQDSTDGLQNKTFDATMNLKRYDMASVSMRRFILRYPYMTLKVFCAIYWQAIKLFCKKTQFYSNKTKQDFTVSRNKSISSH